MPDAIRFEWEIPPEKAFAVLYDLYVEEIRSTIFQLAQSFAPRIEAWMKENAIWTDQTGNARQSLYSDVEKTLTDIVVFLDHGISYGVFLEYANQGDYAIIGPALDYWSIQFWNAVKALFAT